MALPKFLLFFIFTSLCSAVISSKELSDSVVAGDVIGAICGAEASDDSGRVELDQLKASDAFLRDEFDELNSKISSIGSKVDERMQELKSKEKTIKELEMIIKEKSDILTSLQCQVQEKASLNAKVQKVRAYSSAQELEGQIKYIQKEIEAQNTKKEALEARVTITERKIQDLLLKLENLHRTNAEQKSRILSTQHALLAAEEELMKVKLEGAFVSKQLIEVHEYWIPPWLAVYVDHFQPFVISNWNKHGQPALDLIKEKALEKKSEFEKWLRPHVDTFKSEWAPSIKEQCLAFLDEIGLHLQTFSSIAIDKYHVSKESIKPGAVRLKEVTDLFFQVTRNSIESRVLRLQLGMHPYFQEVKKFMEPYVKSFLHRYEEFVKKVNALHQQVQVIIFDLLKSNEFTRPLATKELVWYMASALMALPLIFMFNMVCALFLKKPKRHVRTSHSSHTCRRAKLVHSER